MGVMLPATEWGCSAIGNRGPQRHGGTANCIVEGGRLLRGGLKVSVELWQKIVYGT